MKTINYGTTSKDSNEIGEDYDCAVKAVAIVTQTDYKKVHAMFKAEGRKDGKRTPDYITRAVLKQLKAKTEQVLDFIWKGKAYTIKTDEKPRCSIGWAGELLPEGVYLVHVRGHIAALVDGNLEDWSKGRRHSVTLFERVTMPGTRKPTARKAPTKKAAAKKAPTRRAKPKAVEVKTAPIVQTDDNDIDAEMKKALK